jgi:hypothetical protein
MGGDIAAVVTVAKPLKLVANVGTKTNTDRTAATDPAFFLGGLIYSIRDKIDLDLGYKRGLNKAEADNTYIGGLTISSDPILQKPRQQCKVCIILLISCLRSSCRLL